MKKPLEQIRVEIEAYFAVREMKMGPLTLLEEEIKATFDDPKIAAATLRWYHKDVMDYMRDSFSARERALFDSMRPSGAPAAKTEDQEFIDKLLARGKLSNDDEFRELLSIIDNLVQSKPVDESLVAKLNALLAERESRAVKRKRSH